MVSTRDKPYTYNQSRELAIIPEDIKKSISNTPRKKRDTHDAHTFEESVNPPPLTVYTVNVLKPQEDSPFTSWVFGSPPMTEANMEESTTTNA